MEKFKVKVTNASEVLEIENILSKIGLVARDYSGFSYPKYIANNIDGEFSDYTMFDSGIDEFKLLTINELKDMVVLKRDDPDDATHESDVDDCDELYFIDSNKNLYRWFCGSHWVPTVSYKGVLKLIKDEVVKEYLFKYNDQYTLVELSKEDAESNPEQYIEVPEGADVYARCNIFGDYKWLPKIIDGDWSVLWQREKESLNDKIATAEVVRQEGKHRHYKKDVSHLNVIDVYRVLELYGVESHAVGHAIKKLLCCGQRGAKGRKQDIQEAIDSLNRELEMVTEDEL